MNAKEWLIQEFEINEYSAEHNAFLTLFETSIPLMERYASYREKELRYKIFEFRNKLSNKMINDCTSIKGYISAEIASDFDEHFNIGKL